MNFKDIPLDKKLRTMESLAYIQDQFKQSSTPIVQRLPPKVVSKFKHVKPLSQTNPVSTYVSTTTPSIPLTHPSISTKPLSTNHLDFDLQERELSQDRNNSNGRYNINLLNKYKITYGAEYKVKCSYDSCTATTYKCYMYENKPICSKHLPKLLSKLRQSSKRQ